MKSIEKRYFQGYMEEERGTPLPQMIFRIEILGDEYFEQEEKNNKIK